MQLGKYVTRASSRKHQMMLLRSHKVNKIHGKHDHERIFTTYIQVFGYTYDETAVLLENCTLSFTKYKRNNVDVLKYCLSEIIMLIR